MADEEIKTLPDDHPIRKLCPNRVGRGECDVWRQNPSKCNHQGRCQVKVGSEEEAKCSGNPYREP